MEETLNFGEFIREHRLKSGYKSQAQLANASGVSKATLSRIEKEVQKPNADTLKALANHLTSTTIKELFNACGYWENGLEKEKNPEDKVIQEFHHNFKEMSEEELLKSFNYVLDGKELSEKQAKYFLRNLKNLVQNLDDVD